MNAKTIERYAVHLPVGLMVGLIEALPDAAQRGEQELARLVERAEMHVRTAKVVGQFSAPRLRRLLANRLEERLDRMRSHADADDADDDYAADESTQETERRSAARRPISDEPVAPGPMPDVRPSRSAAPGPAPAARRTGRAGGARTRVPAPARTESSARPPSPSRPGPAGARAVDHLPIAGYDQLAAPQIVASLPGLSVVELEVVREHELAGRHRRTVLAKISHLLGERPAGELPAGEQP